MDANKLWADMKRMIEELDQLAPWRSWARKHKVKLHVSQWCDANNAYVMPAGLDQLYLRPMRLFPFETYLNPPPRDPNEPEFMVVTSQAFLDTARRLLNPEGLAFFQVPEQEIAEYIAWLKADLPEPSDRKRSDRRRPGNGFLDMSTS